MSVFNGFRIRPGKATDFQIEGDVPKVEVDLVIFAIGLGLNVGMGIEYFQNLIVGMVVIPAPDSVIDKPLDIQPVCPGHSLRLPPDTGQRLHAINEVTQAVPHIPLFAAPGREVG